MKAVLSKRGWKAKLAAALAAATIAAPLGVAAIAPLVPAVQAYADEAQGQWVESGSGSWYRNADGSYPSGCWKEIDGYWYHFDAAGWVQIGWFKDTDGSWYYLREKEDRAVWHPGRSSTTYLFVDGKLYYFAQDGRMAQNEVLSYAWRAGASESYDEWGRLEDGCSCDCFGADGAYVEGWANIPEITLQRYYDDEFVGTATVPGGWIYQTLEDPQFAYWQQIDGSWYYFQPHNYLGQRIGNPSYESDESRPAYFLMATGWCKPAGESSWYYLGTSGAMQTGWVNDGGAWYWLTGSGAMATGWQKIGGTWYYFNASGAMQAGWQKIDGSWYCFAASGAMLHDCWAGNYYLGSSGAMLTDARTPDGYYVGTDGAWVPGR